MSKIIEDIEDEFQSIIEIRRKGGFKEMGKGKFDATKKIEAGLVFQHQDPYMARFAMDNADGLLSRKVLEIDPADVFPADFDIEKYAVSGKIMISIEVKEK